MMSEVRTRTLFILTGLFSWGLILFAWLYLERTLYLAPCPLCMMQRIAFALAGFFSILLGVFWPRHIALTIIKTLLYLSIFLGIGLASRHLYLQSLPPDAVVSCSFDFWGLLEQKGFWSGVLQSLQGTSECTIKDVIWGLTIPTWSMIAFIVLLFITGIFSPKNRLRTLSFQFMS